MLVSFLLVVSVSALSSMASSLDVLNGSCHFFGKCGNSPQPKHWEACSICFWWRHILNTWVVTGSLFLDVKWGVWIFSNPCKGLLDSRIWYLNSSPSHLSFRGQPPGYAIQRRFLDGLSFGHTLIAGFYQPMANKISLSSMQHVHFRKK